MGFCEDLLAVLMSFYVQVARLLTMLTVYRQTTMDLEDCTGLSTG